MHPTVQVHSLRSQIVHDDLFVIAGREDSAVAGVETEAEDVAVVLPLHAVRTVCPRECSIHVPKQHTSVVTPWRNTN